MINFSIGSKKYSLEDRDIEAVYLFGSCARGEMDSASDIDVFILIENCDEDVYVEKKKELSRQLGLPISWISLYRISTVKSMFKYGSYFLWHLKLEGRCLYSKTGLMEDVFKELPLYNRVKQDLKDYLTISRDIYESIQKDSFTLRYELSVLASLVRNTCIAISYQNKIFMFGRLSPVRSCKEILKENFPFSIKEYEDLYKFRISYSRDIDIDLPIVTKEYVVEWLRKVEMLIEFGLSGGALSDD